MGIFLQVDRFFGEEGKGLKEELLENSVACDDATDC
jgi:hypothetical protein